MSAVRWVGKRRKSQLTSVGCMDLNAVKASLGDSSKSTASKVVLSSSNLLDGEGVRNLEVLGGKARPGVRRVGDGNVGRRDGLHSGDGGVRVATLMPDCGGKMSVLKARQSFGEGFASLR